MGTVNAGTQDGRYIGTHLAPRRALQLETGGNRHTCHLVCHCYWKRVRMGMMSVTGNKQGMSAPSMLGCRTEGRCSPGTSSSIAVGNGLEQAC